LPEKWSEIFPNLKLSGNLEINSKKNTIFCGETAFLGIFTGLSQRQNERERGLLS